MSRLSTTFGSSTRFRNPFTATERTIPGIRRGTNSQNLIQHDAKLPTAGAVYSDVAYAKDSSGYELYVAVAETAEASGTRVPTIRQADGITWTVQNETAIPRTYSAIHVLNSGSASPIFVRIPNISPENSGLSSQSGAKSSVAIFSAGSLSTWAEGGVIGSISGGQTTINDCQSVVIGNTIYVCQFNSSGICAISSSTNGQTWTNLTVTGLPLAAGAPERSRVFSASDTHLYFTHVTSNSVSGGGIVTVYRSQNGSTWTSVATFDATTIGADYFIGGSVSHPQLIMISDAYIQATQSRLMLTIQVNMFVYNSTAAGWPVSIRKNILYTMTQDDDGSTWTKPCALNHKIGENYLFELPGTGHRYSNTYGGTNSAYQMGCTVSSPKIVTDRFYIFVSNAAVAYGNDESNTDGHTTITKLLHSADGINWSLDEFEDLQLTAHEIIVAQSIMPAMKLLELDDNIVIFSASTIINQSYGQTPCRLKLANPNYKEEIYGAI